jgi:hypothetical protein
MKHQKFNLHLRKAEKRIDAQQLHDVTKHAENLYLRSEAVEKQIYARRVHQDPWSQTIAHIARND